MEYMTHGMALLVGMLISVAAYGFTLRSTIADIAARLGRVERIIDSVTVISVLPPQADRNTRTARD